MPIEEGGGAFIVWEPKKQEAHNVQRKVFVPEETFQMIKEYVKKKSLHPDELLYPLKETSMRATLCRLFKRVGVQVKSHDFRHGKLSDIGKYLNPQEVRDFAGHSSIKVTDRYLHTSREEVFKKLVAQHRGTVQQQSKETKTSETILPRKRTLKQALKQAADET